MPNKLDVPQYWSSQMGQAIAKQNELAEGVYETGQSLADMREGYRRERAFWNEGGPQMASTTHREVATPYGNVTVRLHRPSDDPVLPLIVYIHGGGWILGDPSTHDRITRKLAASAGAAVASIDYTLSPEAKFPQALHECAAVVREIASHSQEWGIDPTRIGIAGDSGGANLSFATHLYLRDECGEGNLISSMLLFYGAYGLKDSSSMRLFGGTWDGLTEEDFKYYKDLYFASEEDASSPYFDVLSGDLTYGIPPCYIAAAGLDPLRDDSRTLSAMLGEYGTPTMFEEYAGVIHGYLHHSKIVDATSRTLENAARFYRSIARR